jgi:hypothetical protein
MGVTWTVILQILIIIVCHGYENNIYINFT